MKEKAQLKERSPSQQEQSIKETNTIGLQFNYLIPSMGKSIIVCVSDCVIQLTDNLDCLSDVQVAEKKLFLVQGDKPQLMNWEQFGLRIGIEEDSLLSSETVEVATAALVGGQFKFPKNTVLVSAVYAVSVSKSLLKPLRLEMQHCVDLRGRPGLSQYLEFAIAPVSTPSLPYQFSLVEGGEFSPDSRYGSIQRKEFCLVGILGQTSTNGVPVASVNGDTDEEEEEEQQQQQDEEDEEQRQEEEEEVEQRQKEEEEVEQRQEEEEVDQGHEEEEEVEQRQEEEEEVEQRQGEEEVDQGHEEEEEVEQRQGEEKVEQRHEEEEEVEQRQGEEKVEQRQGEEEVEQQQKKEEVEQQQEEEGEVEQQQEEEEERQEEEKEELQQQEDEQEKEEKDEQQQNGKEDKKEEDDDSSSDSSSESNKTSGPPAAGSGAKG